MVANVRLTELGRERRCTKCGEYWPEDSEFFYVTNRSDQNRPCVQQPCKACYVELPSRRARKAQQIGVRRDEVVNGCQRVFLVGLSSRTPEWGFRGVTGR